MLKISGKKIVSLILVICVILLVVIIGFLTFLENKPSPSAQNYISSHYVGYDKLMAKINKIATDNQDLGQAPSFLKMLNKLREIDDPKISRETALKTIRFASGDGLDVYAGTQNHALYPLQSDFNDFIVANFPEEKNNGFKPLCFDPACSEGSNPVIENVISEINSSALPDYLKENDTGNLKNFIYLTDDSAEAKTGDFLIVADMIRNEPEYKKLKLNDKIADEIENYVKNTYPNEYKDYRASAKITPISNN